MGWGGGALKAAVDIPRRGETRGRKIISTSVGWGKGGWGGAELKNGFFLSDMWHLSLVRRRRRKIQTICLFFSGNWKKKRRGEAERKIYESREGEREGGENKGRRKKREAKTFFNSRMSAPSMRIERRGSRKEGREKGESRPAGEKNCKNLFLSLG